METLGKSSSPLFLASSSISSLDIMFKSCDYCRYRKKKCVLVIGNTDSRTRCGDCEHLNIACEFSHRNASLKRQKKSQHIASQLSSSVPKHRRFSSAETTAVGTTDGETQQADACSLAEKIILRDNKLDDGIYLTSIAEKYYKDVHPLAPFLPDELIRGDDMNQDVVLQSCIHLASCLSLHDRRALPDSSRFSSDVQTFLCGREMSLPAAAGLLLLLLRLDLDEGLIKQTFTTIQETRNMGVVSEPILAGACTTHAWLRLVGYSLPPLEVSADVVDNYMLQLDPAFFSYHYLAMSRLVDRFNNLCAAGDDNGHDVEGSLAWARLEYECLLGPIKLPSSLIDVRDEMPATPESVVIHCLQNLLFLSFYAYVLDRQDTLGNMLSLRPVPGVMNFLCALARTVLICRRDIVSRWKLIADAQAQTVRAMLCLWRVSQFETCKTILSLWDDHGEHPDLESHVREQIGPGPWPMELSDGYSVFWTFRDLRSMALEFYIGQHSGTGVQ